MNIGLITNSLVKVGMTDLEEIADWAADHGFTELEVGPSMPLDEKKFYSVMEKGRVKIGALLYCRNFLLQDEDGEEFRRQLQNRIDFAAKLGIKKINTSTGIDRRWDVTETDAADRIRRRPIRSLDAAVAHLDGVLEQAEKYDFKVALETCPLMGNIAISPSMLDELFDRIKSDRLGLAYDPSHLVWEMMNPYTNIFRYKDKIFHVHGKDTEIDRQRLEYTGILTDFSWWRYRVPGLGEIDWNKLISNLYEIGYDGVISLEHEDPVWEGTLPKVQKGLLIGKKTIESALHMER